MTYTLNCQHLSEQPDQPHFHSQPIRDERPSQGASIGPSSPGCGAARESSRKQTRRKAMNKNNFIILDSGLMFHCLIWNVN
jgi:hypothetical protein